MVDGRALGVLTAVLREFSADFWTFGRAGRGIAFAQIRAMTTDATTASADEVEAVEADASAVAETK